MDYEEALIIRAAWYYYIENMTQQSISDKLGISRMRVMKLLDKARQTGIIQFKIGRERSQRLQVEQQLMKTWNLKDAYIIPTPPDANRNESIARAAAMYISDRITENTFINMGYGDTPSRVLNHLANTTATPISIVSLTGGVSYYLPNAQSNIFNARLYLYPTPLLVSSKEMAEAMRAEPTVQEIARMVRLANITVVGVGGMNDQATILNNGILSKNDFLYLSMQGAVGDVLTHFYNCDGVPIQSPIEDRLLSTPLETLKELNNVIGISAGMHKVEAIRAALKGEYLDILITDEETAGALLQPDITIKQ